MLTSSSFIRLPYTPDLTEGGIAFALRSLLYSFDHTSAALYQRLRRVTAEAAVELAFRRQLSQQEIPFEVKPAAPFTEPDKFNVTLGGHRCDIKSFLISHRDQIAEMRRSADVILNAPALVPSDHHVMDGFSDNDLYLFAFVSGLTASSQDDLQKVTETNQPHYLIHAMPAKWRKPLKWNPLGPLVLKSDSEAEMLVEVSGQDSARGFLTRQVHLPPKMRVTVEDPFYSVTSIHVKKMAAARLGIHSPAYKEAHVIAPLEWGNIWVYGMEIILAGFISHGEFRQRAKFMAQNSRVFQFDHTKTKNLYVPISSLNPLQDLFARVKDWQAGR
ncbi:MAG: hypothetical protein HY864_10570 [Chloroflexi bacterium]|nr:hypothetical protein [Chloroflexota bacterium]